jgi:thiol:disulfide interchange protein DsbA
MRFLQKFLIAASMGFIAVTAGAASPANPVDGVHYRTLAQPQPTEPGPKVEVIEFFWYGCPHCNAIEPGLEEWVKKQGDKISFKRVPIAFRADFIPQQRLYYTLEAMGLVDKVHGKVFQAIHGGRQSLTSDADILAFIEKQGIDKTKFSAMYNSFGVKSRVDRVPQLQAAYNVDGVPMIAIDGRYITSPSMVGASMGRQPEKVLEEAALQVMSSLVAKAANEKRAAAPAPAAKPAEAEPAAAPANTANKTSAPANKKPAEPAQKK